MKSRNSILASLFALTSIILILIFAKNLLYQGSDQTRNSLYSNGSWNNTQANTGSLSTSNSPNSNHTINKTSGNKPEGFSINNRSGNDFKMNMTISESNLSQNNHVLAAANSNDPAFRKGKRNNSSTLNSSNTNFPNFKLNLIASASKNIEKNMDQSVLSKSDFNSTSDIKQKAAPDTLTDPGTVPLEGEYLMLLILVGLYAGFVLMKQAKTTFKKIII